MTAPSFGAMAQALPALPRSLLAFLVVLGVLVFVHELGHYLAARWRGVQVDVFSIGFGRALATWRDRAGTQWKVGWLPLGGYVKLHGQESPETVSEETRRGWIPGRTFHDKRVGSRMLVVAGGPAANFALALILFAALFALAGVPEALPEVGSLRPDGPAARAGLRIGDRIDAIGGALTHGFDDIQRMVRRHPGETLEVRLSRGGQVLALPVTLAAQQEGGRRIGVLGVDGGAVRMRPVPPWTAVGLAGEQVWDIASQTLAGLWRVITGRQGMEELGGPLRIAQLSGEVARLGLVNLVAFVAGLSINLGLINLLPIPVLDGGHLVFYLAEAVSGRVISLRMQDYAQRLGFAVIGTVFVFVTWNDLARLKVFRWIGGLMG